MPKGVYGRSAKSIEHLQSHSNNRLGKSNTWRIRDICPKGHDKRIFGRTSNFACAACCNERRWDALGIRIGGRKFLHSDYDKAILDQNGLCAICGNHSGRNALAVDHDHDSGEFRYLLCTFCNTLLRSLENKELKARLEEYLAGFR
jgi:hypothetical protein